MFINPFKNNTEKIKLFTLMFIVLFVIFAFSNYYFVYKYTQFKGKLKKINIKYTRIIKISLFHALTGTIFAFLTFKAFAKGNPQGEESDNHKDSEHRDHRRHRRRRRHYSSDYSQTPEL